ncbi:uncharacterized protein BKA55DRAFT_708864 [Fusarium redolens]|uniref:Thiol-specific monooxygenase n=1 Tax=Fusarium redolens TaxID=48865 RepID=A0A9P9GBX0_FUSRE|nr:uncharacterized protein BKA55DRAFT_708864 [Fusarium redolens]KAH7234907.1 hypothetical protein BKA55DRAFT_708864 [Fusarium redolens]
MPHKIRRVAVVGAGPAGAIATDALVKEGAFDTIRVFDRRSAVGGTWIHTPHLPPGIPSLERLVSGEADDDVLIPENLPAVTPISEAVNSHQHRFSDTPIHENLHSNIAPDIMSYTQEPFPKKLSKKTLDEYGPDSPFRHHSVVREWIEGIFARGGHDKLLELETTIERVEKENGEWVITLRKVLKGRNYWWRETFDAVVVASGHYNVPWFPEVEGLLEFDRKFPGAIQHSKHFREASKYRGKRVIVVGASVSSIEIIHEILGVVDGQVYASIRDQPIPAFGWIPFEHPKISIKPAIQRFDPETGRVHFTDGSYLDNIDHIIYGTGYTFSFPFIPAVQKRVKNAYRRLPGLGGGFTFRAYEWQSVAIARFLAGRAKALPSIPEQLEWERQRVNEKRGGKDYYSIAPDYERFFEYLRNIAGEPAAGTSGRQLPAFDPQWLVIWGDMVTPRLESWRRKRKEAENVLKLKSKL